VKAIVQREFASYFNTMVGYIFVAICMLVCGVFFTSTNIIGGSAKFYKRHFQRQLRADSDSPRFDDAQLCGGTQSKSDHCCSPRRFRFRASCWQVPLRAARAGRHAGATLCSHRAGNLRRTVLSEILLGYIGMALLAELHRHRTVRFFRFGKPAHRCIATLVCCFSSGFPIR
jgi:hypothetical protein